METVAHTPPYLAEIVALLAASALVAYVCHRLRIMPIVSFLVTGALVGPHALGLVHDEALVEAAAEIGVILLLFTIGLEFSLEKLARIKRIIFVGGGLQVTLVIAVVTGVLALAGIDWRAGVFTGCLVALSSTAIVMKVLMSTGEMGTADGHAALGILIFQDLAVVAMVLLVPMLGGAGGSGTDIALALGKAVGIVVLVLVAARRLMPVVLEAVARTCSQEIFLLSVVVICMGTAYLTSLAGVSLSLGAFLAGLLVSESRFSEMAFAEILPLQILFSATFFVSVGLLLDLGYVIDHPLMILGVIGAVLLIKTVTTGAGLMVLGYGAGAAAGSALVLAQVGEFSFVLERAGRSMGLSPAGLESGGAETFIGATVALMIATPFLHRLGNILRRRRAGAAGPGIAPHEDRPDPGGGAPLRNHVLIAGFGEGGHTIAHALKEHDLPYVIVTLSPDGAREAERGQLRVLRGNYMRQHELVLAGLRHARLLVVADDDAATTHRVVAMARAINPGLPVFARVRSAEDVRELQTVGVTEVICEEREAIASLLARVLEASDVDRQHIQRDQQRLRRVEPGVRHSAAFDQLEAHAPVSETRFALSEEQLQSDRCRHAAGMPPVNPNLAGCEECLKSGDVWVHLRVCMSCGHVGCCDSSRNRHAMKHYQATDHPIILSAQPGEDWAWCYEDRTFL